MTLEQLLAALKSSTHDLTVTDLVSLHPDLPRRTAQRWLQELTATGRVIATGKGPARRYRAAPTPPAGLQTAAESDRFPEFIPLSPDSREVLAYIDQPLEKRRPVGYIRDFLDAYQPNRSGYLPETLRRQLRKTRTA